MSQQVQSGDEVAPLDKLTQWTPTEGILSYFEARLLSQQTQVYQDLIERKVTEISDCMLFYRNRSVLKTLMWQCIHRSIVQILQDYSENLHLTM